MKDGPAHPQCPCLAHEPQNGPTRILTAAVWLKMSKKYFNEGTAKEVCKHFDVRAKQLSRVLMGKSTSVVLRPVNARPPRNRQSDGRKQMVKNDTTHHTQLQLHHLISAYGEKQS